jgi:hypothetical protein
MKRRNLWISLVVVGILVSVGILLHELIHAGNQGELLFPGLQKARAFHVITEIPYSGEEVSYFEYGSDSDADSWYYLAARIDEVTLRRIVEKKSLTKLPFSADAYRWWRFRNLPKPDNPDYYSVTFSRKGQIHLWYDRKTQMLYLVDEWIR